MTSKGPFRATRDSMIEFMSLVAEFFVVLSLNDHPPSKTFVQSEEGRKRKRRSLLSLTCRPLVCSCLLSECLVGLQFPGESMTRPTQFDNDTRLTTNNQPTEKRLAGYSSPPMFKSTCCWSTNDQLNRSV